MKANKVMRYLGGIFLVALLLISVSSAQAAPKKKKADVYFGALKSVDVANRIVHVDVINVNHKSKGKGPRSFTVATDAGFSIEQMDGKIVRNMTLHNVAESSWIWVSSYDGQTAVGMTGSPYTSYLGNLVDVQGGTIRVKLDERTRGARRNKIPATDEPRSFMLTEKVLYRYNGKIIHPSFIASDAYLRVTSLEKGGVVMITVLDKKK
jgi:hypothetical protein